MPVDIVAEVPLTGLSKIVEGMVGGERRILGMANSTS
jgi:hypothetical protein